MTGSVHLQWHNVLFFLIKSGHWLAFSTKKVKKLTDPARIKSCVVLRPLNITWTKPKRRLRFPDELVDARCELQLLLSAIRVSTISVEIFFVIPHVLAWLSTWWIWVFEGSWLFGRGRRGGGGGGGRSNKRHFFSLTFRPPPPRSPLSLRPGLKKMQDYNILCSPLKRVASFLKIFSCRTRSITEKIASSFIKAVYLLRSTRRLLPKHLLAVRNYRI